MDRCKHYVVNQKRYCLRKRLNQPRSEYCKLHNRVYAGEPMAEMENERLAIAAGAATKDGRMIIDGKEEAPRPTIKIPKRKVAQPKINGYKPVIRGGDVRLGPAALRAQAKVAPPKVTPPKVSARPKIAPIQPQKVPPATEQVPMRLDWPVSLVRMEERQYDLAELHRVMDRNRELIGDHDVLAHDGNQERMARNHEMLGFDERPVHKEKPHGKTLLSTAEQGPKPVPAVGYTQFTQEKPVLESPPGRLNIHGEDLDEIIPGLVRVEMDIEVIYIALNEDQTGGEVIITKEKVFPPDDVKPPKNDIMNECPICYEEYSLDDMIQLDCSHNYCLECMNGHLTTCIGNRKLEFKCPDPTCKWDISQRQAGKVLNKEDLQIMELMSVRSAMTGNKDVYYCPKPDCVGLAEVIAPVTQFICPLRSCGYSFCILCKEDWHYPLRCKIKREETVEEKELQELLKDKRYKRCPVCDNVVMKSSGCNKMKCACGSTFCFICGVHIELNNAYDHFGASKECQLFTAD